MLLSSQLPSHCTYRSLIIDSTDSKDIWYMPIRFSRKLPFFFVFSRSITYSIFLYTKWCTLSRKKINNINLSGRLLHFHSAVSSTIAMDDSIEVSTNYFNYKLLLHISIVHRRIDRDTCKIIYANHRIYDLK